MSERERFYIEAHYHASVTGDWEKARQVYELWAQLYPRDDIPHLNVSVIDSAIGEYEKARTESAESLQLLPGDCMSYGALLDSLLHLDRLDEAQGVVRRAEQQHSTCSHLQEGRYDLAFLQNNKQEMAHVLNASRNNPDLLSWQAKTAAYYGRERESRELVRQIALSGEHTQQDELSSFLEVLCSEPLALLGDGAFARERVRDALMLSKGRDVEGISAITLALAHDEAGARSLANDLARRFPESTIVQTNYLPSIDALVALNHGDGPKALASLQMATPYELGDYEDCNALLPIFFRGQAYLLERRGSEAATEFQKIVDHRGIVLTSPIGPLAHLEIARAFQMQGQTAKAHAAYGDFFALWKDADPDAAILQQAKAEYAKLH